MTKINKWLVATFAACLSFVGFAKNEIEFLDYYDGLVDHRGQAGHWLVRDAGNKTTGQHGDPTVPYGWAMYTWDFSKLKWIKICAQHSLDGTSVQPVDSNLVDKIARELDVGVESRANAYSSKNLQNSVTTINTSINELDKRVDIAVTTINTSISGLDKRVETIEKKISSVYHLKGSCEYEELPTTGNTDGDTWYVTDNEKSYAWSAEKKAWYSLGGGLDLSVFKSWSDTKTYIDTTSNGVLTLSKEYTDSKIAIGSGGRSVIYDYGFDNDSVCYRAVLALESDVQHAAPPTNFVYLQSLDLGSKVWGQDYRQTKDASEGGFTVVESGGSLKLQSLIPNTTTLDTWAFTSTAITGLVLNVDIPDKTTYDYSHPYDWNIAWTALDVPDTKEYETTAYVTNSAGPVIATIACDTIRNSRAKLSIQYFDEVNIPTFNLKMYEIIEGDARLESDTLIANRSGVVKVRATMSNDETRNTEIPMFQYTKRTTSTRYSSDSMSTTWAQNRKRVNDWHLNLLTNYRSNPTTNYVYYTWAEPKYNKHCSNPGDRFTGEYGKRFHPYAHHGVSSSGENGFWWAHAPISKHVLLAAAHYGDYNFNRFKGGTEYFNWDGKFSGKVSVKVKNWYYLSTWAREHGFEGTDAQCGDLAFWVVEGEIPDECLPYIATADWINANYGVDIINYPGSFYVPTVMLNQAAMVSIRGLTTGSCGSGASVPSLGATWYDEDGEFIDSWSSQLFRYDLAKLIGKGGWHDGVIGDSGKPSYLYDPKYTTGLTDEEGQPLLRPIILHPTTWADGGSSGNVPRHAKVVKAFVEWVGDTLDYTLGDIDNQSTDSEVIKQHAYEAMGGEYTPESN